MTNLNSGFITIVTVGDKEFEVDGYVTKRILKEFCSKRTIDTLDWTNHLGKTELVLSESNFIMNEDGDAITVEFADIDPNKKRTFDTSDKVAEVLEEFISGTNC